MSENAGWNSGLASEFYHLWGRLKNRHDATL
jgi:hypothetical protein